MPDNFIIQGRGPMEGELEVRGAKNVAMALLAASTLTDEPCILKNLPHIEDVFLMVKLLESGGTKIDWLDERTVKVNAANFDPKQLNDDLVTKFRGSVLLLSPLCFKLTSFVFPHPGGCHIGARPIDTNLDILTQYGISIKKQKQAYLCGVPARIQPSTIVLRELSVTATENAILMAAPLEGRTVINVADSDYQSQELIKFLQEMGARIRGLGTHTLEIYGNKKLRGATYTIPSDPIEAGTFVLLAAATKSHLAIKNVPCNYLTLFIKKLRDAGLSYKIKNSGEASESDGFNNKAEELDLADIEVYPWTELTLGKIQALPHPGIASDLQSAFGVLATRAKGATLLHDPLYEGRLKYLEELNKMGAEVIFCDPHRAIVNGPTPLYGTTIKANDIRGGAALVIAGLIANGTTTIENAYQIDRGYEKLEERLQKIGADIQRIKA